MADPRSASQVLLAGRYRLESWVGGGGMGDVFTAEDTRTGRRVAVKLLNERHRKRADAIERFRREARAAARIEHENVVEIVDFGADADGQHYLVMELLRGESLDCTLERELRLPGATVRAIAAQLADALQAAHALGVIHRDLKPSNCYRTQVGGDERIKILDFGLAKLHATGHDEAPELTTSGAMLGTLRYMAPEQAHDPASVDPQADLYSLGVIVYRLLTGAAPVGGENELHFLNNLLHAAPRPLAEAVPELAWPERLEAFFRRALAKRPAERFPDARSFAAALLDSLPDSVPFARPAAAAAPAAPPEVDVFGATMLASTPLGSRGDAPGRLIERTCRQLSARSAFYVDARNRWEDEEYPLPNGIRLIVSRGDLCMAREAAVLCPMPEDDTPSPRSLAQRVCEFGGTRVAEAWRSSPGRARGRVYPADGGRLFASCVLFAVFAPNGLGLLGLRELSAQFAAGSLVHVERQGIRSLAVPALFWGALGGGRQAGIVAPVEAFARALAAAPRPILDSLRLVIPDGGEALVRVGGELTLDLSDLPVPPTDRTQRFALGRYDSMRALGNALWAAVPHGLRPAWESYGARWCLRLVQDGRTLAAAQLRDENAKPSALGLKHGSRLVLQSL